MSEVGFKNNNWFYDVSGVERTKILKNLCLSRLNCSDDDDDDYGYARTVGRKKQGNGRKNGCRNGKN